MTIIQLPAIDFIVMLAALFFIGLLTGIGIGIIRK